MLIDNSANIAVGQVLMNIKSLAQVLLLAGTCLCSVQAELWEIRLPTPLGNNLNHVIFDGEFFMAAGDGGTILISKDGANWMNRSPPFDLSVWAKGAMFSIRRVGDDWFAMGRPAPGGASATVMFRSVDRLEWTVNEFGSNRLRADMAYGAGRYVWPVVNGHYVESSTDQNGSAIFEKVNFPGSPNRILFANDRFVIVGTKGLIASSSVGVSWTVHSTGISKELYGLKYLGGAFYAVGVGDTILRSEDGTQWTKVHGDDSYETLSDVELFQGTYFASRSFGDAILFSIDGISWESRGLPGEFQITGMATDQRRLVAVGLAGLSVFTVDGVTWSGLAPSEEIEGFGHLASNGASAVISRRFGEGAFTEDGLNWTKIDLGEFGLMSEVVWLNGAYLASDPVSGKILKSADGMNWAASSVMPTSDSVKMRTAGDRVFLFANHGLVFSSTNGVEWESIQLDSGPLQYVAFGNGVYVLGRSDRRFVSSDGVVFEQIYTGPALWNATFHDGSFYGVNSNTLFRSSDSDSWIQVTSNPFPSWFGAGVLHSVGDTLYRLGSNGLVASSTNGELWSYADTGLASSAINIVSLRDSRLIAFEQGEIVQSREEPPDSGLANISVRGFFPPGDSVQIGGFVIEGSDGRDIIIRGIGPSIESVSLDAINNPSLDLFRGNSRLFRNDDWGEFADLDFLTERSRNVGAFPPDEGSRDAAMIINLDPGAYTAVVRSVERDSGIGLVEIFDAGISAGSEVRIVNLSARGTVISGPNILIAGFVVAPGRPAKVLIRGIGPSLDLFGVQGYLERPHLNLFRAGHSIGTASAWSELESKAMISGAVLESGAFPLPRDSQDAAMLAYLGAGAYTVHLTGIDGTGTALIEIYLLD